MAKLPKVRKNKHAAGTRTGTETKTARKPEKIRRGTPANPVDTEPSEQEPQGPRNTKAQEQLKKMKVANGSATTTSSSNGLN